MGGRQLLARSGGRADRRQEAARRTLFAKFVRRGIGAVALGVVCAWHAGGSAETLPGAARGQDGRRAAAGLAAFADLPGGARGDDAPRAATPGHHQRGDEGSLRPVGDRPATDERRRADRGGRGGAAAGGESSRPVCDLGGECPAARGGNAHQEQTGRSEDRFEKGRRETAERKIEARPGQVRGAEAQGVATGSDQGDPKAALNDADRKAIVDKVDEVLGIKKK